MKDGQFQYVMVSQFVMELQRLMIVDGEDPPRMLHFNPRLKGDWSEKPVIELNTYYIECSGGRLFVVMGGNPWLMMKPVSEK